MTLLHEMEKRNLRLGLATLCIGGGMGMALASSGRQPDGVSTLCAVGAGTMGTGIAQLGGPGGIRVHVIDTSQDALARSRARLDKSLQGGIERGKLTEERADQVRGLIEWHAELTPCGEADWVVEAVFEDFDVKRGIFEALGTLVHPGVTVASNTSTICIHRLAALYREPERVIGMHFSTRRRR